MVYATGCINHNNYAYILELLEEEVSITIKDIAKEAGVTPSTVSRVINNNKVISEKTRKKVQQVMKDMHFHPNSLARNLSNQSTSNIALLVDIDSNDKFTNPFFYEELHGIEQVVYNSGYFLMLANEATFSHTHNNAIDQIVFEKRVDGVIIPPSIADKELIERLNKINFPFVVAGKPQFYREETDWVDIDNTMGGYLGVEHLNRQGYHNIAFIGGNQADQFNQDRLTGYKKGLETAHMTENKEYMCECTDISVEAGTHAAQDLLALKNPPDSIICCHNLLAYGAMEAISAQGLQIPQDIGLLSFDNYPLADFVKPKLTIIDIDVYKLGIETANLLMRRIHDKGCAPSHFLIQTKVIERASTKKYEANIQ